MRMDSFQTIILGIVDLSLISTKNLEFLEMGACFDFFDKLSHHTATAAQIGEIAHQNRLLLMNMMLKHGFLSYEKEFWHYSYYKREIDTPMDVPITSKYRGWNVSQ